MEYQKFEQRIESELARVNQLGDFLDQEIAEKVRKPLKNYYSRTYQGPIEIVEITCGRIYALNDLGKPIGVIAAHPQVCLELKETDTLVAKLGWRDNFWHFLRVDSIDYAGPEDDMANQKRKREKFLE